MPVAAGGAEVADIVEVAQGSGLEAAILLSLGLGVLAALAGYAIQLHLNEPLRELTQAARRVSAGETPAPLPTDGPAEIAAVGSAFNQMTRALQDAEATRADARGHLARHPHAAHEAASFDGHGDAARRRQQLRGRGRIVSGSDREQNAIVYGGSGLAVRTWATRDALTVAVGDREGFVGGGTGDARGAVPARPQRARTAAARGGGCRLSSGSRGCTAAVCSFMRAMAAGSKYGSCCRSRAAHLRSSHASMPTRNATPAMTGTVSIRMMPKFGISSPYMIGLYSTTPDTIANVARPMATIRRLRAVRDSGLCFASFGGLLEPGALSCWAGMMVLATKNAA